MSIDSPRFALLVMFELRNLPNTVNNIYKNIVDYYNADIILLCQKINTNNTDNDDIENIKLFNRNIIYSELYEKPDPLEYFNDKNILNYPNENWNNNGCLQIYINMHKMSKVLTENNYINNYDYFIIIRTDIDILFPYPPKYIFKDIPHGLYSYDAKYCRLWGGLGISTFNHKDFIIEYLKSPYDCIIKKKNIDIFIDNWPKLSEQKNQENFLNYAMFIKNLEYKHIQNINFYYNASNTNARTTWSKPIMHNKYNVICKYEEQCEEAFDNFMLWNTNYRWEYKDNVLKLNKKIHIDINIPFYTYNCPLRTIITEKVFRHYLDIKDKLKDKAIFSFTLIGSEENISKNLFLKYFNDINDTYIEFDQKKYNSTVGYNDKFLTMITDKFRVSFRESFNKNPDISLLAGSNDYISCNFYEQIIDFYDPHEKQLYGIDNYTNGENCVLFHILNSEFNDKSRNFIWDGISDYSNRKRFHYCGATIGFSKKLFITELNNLLNEIICCDEGLIEENTLKLNNVKKFNSKNVFYINTKSESNSEITSYQMLVDNTPNKNKLAYNELNIYTKKNIIKEFFDLYK